SRAPMYILRGAMPIDVMTRTMEQPLLRLGVRLFGARLIGEVPYTDNYFLDDARRVRQAVTLPLIYVGGAASRASIDAALDAGLDAVAMARALIRDPAFVRRLREEERAAAAPRAADAGCDHCN